jgi:erythromycin esterase
MGIKAMNKKKGFKVKKITPLLIAILIFFGIYQLFFKDKTVGVNELKENLIPFETVEATKGFEDMKVLKEILKDKQIVAMGEATHGTREFFQMKHRMFEFLVEEMGYRVFAIEDDFTGVQAINEYILYGKGSAMEAIKSITNWPWFTEEVLEMVEWRRTYNEDPNHERKIKFYGFDMQHAYENTRRTLSYMKKVDEDIFNEFDKKLKYVKNNNVQALTTDQLNEVKSNVEELQNIFNEKKETFAKKTSQTEYDIVAQQLKVLSQSIEKGILRNKPTSQVGDESSAIRDRSMAENVKWIIDYESKFGNDKIMLWAHNGHVNKADFAWKTMGEYLYEEYKDKYYSIGFEFYSGTFNAYSVDATGKQIGNLQRFSIEKSSPKAFSSMFKNTEIPLSFIDFKSASKNEKVRKILEKKQLFHCIGAVYGGVEEQSFINQAPIRAYDGLIFIRDTSSAKELKK